MSEEIAEAPASDPQVEPVSQEPSDVQEEKQDEQASSDPQQQEPPKEELVPVKRIHRMRAALGDKERQLQEAQKRIAEYEAKLAKVPLDDKPKIDDFDTPEEYAERLADWKLEQQAKERDEKSKEPSVEEIANQKAQVKIKELEFVQKENEIRKTNPNYDENAQVVNQFLGLANKNDPRFAAFASVVLDAGPALINHLGANPKEIMALFNAPTPYDVQDMLEGIVEKLGASQGATQGKQAPAETLPPPPTALRGTTKGTKSLDDLTGQELLDRFLYSKGKK